MSRDDFTDKLAERLRHDGVAFNPAELAAFSADAQRQPAADPDVEDVVRRFRDARRAEAAKSLRRKRGRALMEAACLIAIGLILLFFAVIVWIEVDLTNGTPNPNVEPFVPWMKWGGLLIGPILVAAGLTHGLRTLSMRLKPDDQME